MMSYFLFLVTLVALCDEALSFSTHSLSHTVQRVPMSLRMASIETKKLQGFDSFTRTNPMSDKISASRFHHVEYYCGDATTTYKRFTLGLGMKLISKSDLSTGNSESASYVIQSGELTMCFTAPYQCYTDDSQDMDKDKDKDKDESDDKGDSLTGPVDALVDTLSKPFPGFDTGTAAAFFRKHGLGVRAIAIEVANVQQCWETMLKEGGVSIKEPTIVMHQADTENATSNKARPNGFAKYAEVALYGDVVLRLVETDGFQGAFWPNFQDVNEPLPELLAPSGDYGLHRFDHVVGNLFDLTAGRERIRKMTGFHDFAEFVAEDVGTVDSGLNSVVLANNNEMVLLPLNEPTYGTKRKSQIQTYLEQNNGEGVQHLALFSNDIFLTLRSMRAVQAVGGFELMDPQPPSYYEKIRVRLGDALTEAQYRQCEELGILADKDDQGVLLQIFTKPVGDKPTLFLEIIQRIGCQSSRSNKTGEMEMVQKPGCGGFGKGNFKDLFKSIEDYETDLGI
jgi:4-hydroxyphenylpyruvate dioxygenase